MNKLDKGLPAWVDEFRPAPPPTACERLASAISILFNGTWAAAAIATAAFGVACLFLAVMFLSTVIMGLLAVSFVVLIGALAGLVMIQTAWSALRWFFSLQP